MANISAAANNTPAKPMTTFERNRIALQLRVGSKLSQADMNKVLQNLNKFSARTQQNFMHQMESSVAKKVGGNKTLSSAELTFVEKFSENFSLKQLEAISKQNQLILKKRYVELAKYVYKINLDSKKTDFSHDEEFNRLIKNIRLMESYIGEIEKK